MINNQMNWAISLSSHPFIYPDIPETRVPFHHLTYWNMQNLAVVMWPW